MEKQEEQQFENLIHLQQNASDAEADSTENMIDQISNSKTLDKVFCLAFFCIIGNCVL